MAIYNEEAGAMRRPMDWLPWLLGLGLVGGADYFLWQIGSGLAWAAMFTLLVLAVWLRSAQQRIVGWRDVSVAILTLVPLVDHPTLLSIGLALAGIGFLALLRSRALPPRCSAILSDVLRDLVSGPVRLAGDLRRVAPRLPQGSAGRFLLGWGIPLALGAVFAALFVEANPILGHWIVALEHWGLSIRVDFWRMAFWAAVLAGIWGFLSPRYRVPGPILADIPTKLPHRLDRLLPAPVLLRGLVLFNAIFLVQTGLDLAFLWGGLRLPEGMSYAEYAHRGAYPLIAAALLAGGITLAATREGGAGAGSATIRWLSYVWTGQTVWLVISSALRLSLYVETYGLSLWRVAAFVWISLVAMGLVLIMARLALGRSTAWLIDAVILSTLLTLLASQITDIRAMIARHNLAISREMGGTGQPLDLGYLCGLGPAALPVLQQAAERLPDGRIHCAVMLETRFRQEMQTWPGHTLRNRRILAALAPPTPLPLDLSYRDLDNRAQEEPWP